MPVPTGRALQEPSQFNHIDRETIEFALEFYDRQIEECKRRAREQPGTQFSVNFHITHEEMCRRRYGLLNVEYVRRRDHELRQNLRVQEDPAGLCDNMNIFPPEWLNSIDSILENRNKAHERATELLKSWLLPSQLAEFEKDARFTVQGSDTGTYYRLIPERGYNILELDSAMQPTGQKFCVVPRESVAQGDQLLAQKIWLETDETRTLKIANKIVRMRDARGFLRNVERPGWTEGY